MPLIQQYSALPDSQIVIWRIEEELSYFDKDDLIAPELRSELATLHPIKQRDYLVSRFLYKECLGIDPVKNLRKDSYGKTWTNIPNLFVSISHTKQWIAIAQAHQNVGLDIQSYENKIEQIAFKFMSDEEMEQLELWNISFDRIKLLCLYWSLKEAAYKCYGKKELIFKRDIKVTCLFELGSQRPVLSVVVNKLDQNFKYQVYYELQENFALVLVSE